MIAYFTEIAGPAFGPVIGFAFIFVLLAIAIWVAIMLIRRFRSGLFVSNSKGRAPRLAVIDAVPVDSHRRLVLVRRDDIEHLIMIGGPTDIVVEAGIGKPQLIQPAAQQATQAVQQRIQPQTAPVPQVAQTAPVAQTTPQQRTASMAAREAVTDVERGRLVRAPDTLLPQRRAETPMAAPSVAPAPSQPQPPVQNVQRQAVVAPTAEPAPQAAVQPRSNLDMDLDRLLGELRPNPLQDR